MGRVCRCPEEQRITAEKMVCRESSESSQLPVLETAFEKESDVKEGDPTDKSAENVEGSEIFEFAHIMIQPEGSDEDSAIATGTHGTEVCLPSSNESVMGTNPFSSPSARLD